MPEAAILYHQVRPENIFLENNQKLIRIFYAVAVYGTKRLLMK